MNDKKRILLHIACWLAFLCLPFFISYINGGPLDFTHFMHLLPTYVVLAALFYLNYFILIDALLFKKRVTIFVILNLFIVFAIMLLSHYVLMPPVEPEPMPMPEGIPHEPHMPGFRERFPMMLLHQGISLLFFIVLSVAIRMTHNSYKKDIEIQTFETEKSRAELTNLKSQLNPHFLFNSLNNIYALAAIDSERTQYAVHNLSDLLRYVLYESEKPSVPLQSEVDFVKSYTELMKLRYGSGVDISESYPDAAQGIHVAPLIYISLVENAFKHGIDSGKPSFVHISIQVEEGNVICKIENSNHPKQKAEGSDSGIGVENLKKRLAFLYPDRHTFRSEVEGGVYHTELIIPKEV